MKKFKIDRQTLDELNLLGKFRSGTVYHLFNKTRTRGGEQLLDEMFHNPLTNSKSINARSEVFRYFQHRGFYFELDAGSISTFREYLDIKVYKNAGMVRGSLLLKKVLAGLTRDEQYKKSVQGLHAAIQTLRKVAAISLEMKDASGAFQFRVQEVQRIMSSPRLQRLLKVDIYRAMPLGVLASYEHLLKGGLIEEMESILRFVYEVDVYQTVAQVAIARGFHYAEALPSEDNILECTNLRHPCIEGAIGNDLLLNESKNVLFLTGANMAGKSTWMKSLGIGVYLAHMGFPLAVDKMVFSVRDGLYSSINVADNISLGYSHFYAEVVRVKQAAEAAASGDRLMLMFDELFKGTNVKDAYDGTLAVTEGFADYVDCLFVVSTHIIEVGEALKTHSNIQFNYMPTLLEDGIPKYTYKMREGITEDRQGMMIIRNEGILELMD